MMLSRKSCHSTFTRMMRVVIISIIILSIFDNWHVLFFGPWIKVHLSNLITYLIREKCHLILVQDTNAKSILQNFVTTSIKIALFVSFTRKVTFKSDKNVTYYKIRASAQLIEFLGTVLLLQNFLHTVIMHILERC